MRFYERAHASGLRLNEETGLNRLTTPAVLPKLALSTAELNQVHGPVKTQFGYHLLEITSRTD